MGTTTTAADAPRSAIDPGRDYRPAELAGLVGVSRQHLYSLCRARLLGHVRSRPDGKGPITISGRHWLAYRQSCEVRPKGGDREGEGEAASTPALAPPRRRAGPRAGVGRADPLAEFERVASRL